MRIQVNLGALGSRVLGRRIAQCRRNEDGGTAVEFAIVATPFLMFIFGLIGVALNFFIMSSVEKGMDQASRLVRTGQAQAADMTVDQFKQKICTGAGNWIRCNKLQVFVKKYPDWASVTPEPCLNPDGSINVNTAPGSQLIAEHAGSASEIVIVTTCYKWELTASVPYLHLGNLSDDSMMLQDATAFRSEPYEVNDGS